MGLGVIGFVSCTKHLWEYLDFVELDLDKWVVYLIWMGCAVMFVEEIKGGKVTHTSTKH